MTTHATAQTPVSGFIGLTGILKPTISSVITGDYGIQWHGLLLTVQARANPLKMVL